MKNNAVNITSDFMSGSDISSDEKRMLGEIVTKTGFILEKNIWRSSYWGSSQIGASHWSGKFKNNSAVLKIQGAKPNISEVSVINKFTHQNKSKIIRPPVIYTHIPWNDTNGYEAIITEFVQGDKVIEDGNLVSQNDVSIFMKLYKEYRKNCIPQIPWVDKPVESMNFEIALNDLLATSKKAYPNSKLRQSDDFDLARDAYKLLSNVYQNVNLEFIHGHFSCKDLIYLDKSKEKVVLFSNLFWKWRYPYFDSVFAYHWFMYELAHVDNITPEEVENQRKIWLSEISKVIEPMDLKLLNAALLERAVAGFIIDSFLCDPKKKISKYLYESSKNEAKRLMSVLK